MGGNSRIAVPWSDLPCELLDKMASCFDNETDVRRFRAVCSSWRSSTTPFKKLPPTPLTLPFPLAKAGESIDPEHDGAYFTLTERTVYRIQLPECKDQPDFWLVKTEASEGGKLRILNPLSHREIKILPENKMPKVLNTLDFRVSEVCKSYALRYVNPSNPNHNDDYRFARKVAVSASVEKNEYVVMAIDENDTLWYIKSGDEKWTRVHLDCRDSFHDIINYKGQFRAVDYDPSLWLFDSSLVVTEISPLAHHIHSSKRHLVEHSGELFYILEVTDMNHTLCSCDGVDINIGCQCFSLIKNTVVEILISRLDERREFLVEETQIEIDGIIFFVGDDCSFSVSGEGVKGYRVFYTDEYISFRTGEEKNDKVFDYGYDHYCDGNSGCGYGGYVCDCYYFSNAARVDSFVPSDDVKLKFRGMHGHNIGVWDSETGKLGSLLMFPDYADVFWSPPSWLSRRS